MPEHAVLTYADLSSFPDDNLRREIIDGELVVSPAPRLRHQRIVQRLAVLIGTFIDERGAGEVFHAPTDVVFDDINVCEPDLLVLTEEQRLGLGEQNIQVPPALVIEVLSNPRIDKVRKRDVYARFGVPEYWIIDPDADRVEIYRLVAPGHFAKPEHIEPPDDLEAPSFPGLSIDLAHLFRR